MIDLLLALLVWLAAAGDADAEALRRTAPTYLNHAQAVEHLTAARVAGVAYELDADLLLAIAWRESRYTHDAVGPESGGRVSCGVMTPEPVARCSSQTALEGYIAGAKHLRRWLDVTGNQRASLLGFAGGYRLIRACASGPVLRARGNRGVDICKTAELQRAAWIKSERLRTKGST